MKQYAPPILGGNVYRLFNEVTGEHFFTTDENEKEVVLKYNKLEGKHGT